MSRRAAHPVCDYDIVDGCWIVRGRLDRDGYRQARRVPYRGMMVHRAMYLHHGRTLPAGYTIDHLCRNRACVNPDHLEAVPHGVNVNRGAKRKLSDEQVLAIASDTRASGVVAAEYGIDRVYVWQVRTGYRPKRMTS